MNKLIASGVLAATLAGGGLAVAALNPLGVAGAQEPSGSTTTTAGTAQAQPPANRSERRQAWRHHVVEHRQEVVATAAGALGVSPDELRSDLQSGKSIADVAAGKGVDLQSVKDALTAQATKALDQAVADGKITQNRADQAKQRLPQVVDRAVNAHKGDGEGRRQQFRQRLMDRRKAVGATAADALGMSPDELRSDLQSGKSIADVAADKGVDLQSVKDALTAQATKALDQAVADGKITQDRADQAEQRLPQAIDRVVNAHRGGK